MIKEQKPVSSSGSTVFNHDRPSQKKDRGYVIILVISIAAILFVLLAGMATSVINENWFSHQEKESFYSLDIAEAGLNYYIWFLNHNADDWQDGQDVEGPYYHDYEDGFGNIVGRFRLEITPPEEGSTIGTVVSTGFTARDQAPSRTVTAQIGIPSLSKYAMLTHTDIWFGDSESVDGKLHSNGGIRFDGTCNDTVTSAQQTYICEPHHGCSDEEKPGVWGDGGPDSFWSFPVSEIDFDQITGDLNTLFTLAYSAEGDFYDTTNKYGYLIVLDDNNTATDSDDTYDLYKVTKTWQDSGWTVEGGWVNYRDRIRETDLLNTYSMPANGVIYCDDNVWVAGSTSSRVTIVAAHLPEQESQWRSLVISDDLTYYAQDGTAAIGLIGQEDIRLAADSPDSLEIDAIMLAQRGKVIRPYYSSNIRNDITTYGGVITYNTWTWSWVSGATITSGYRYTTSQYDPHLLYGPPPNYPTTGVYEILSWEEILPE